MVRKKKPRKGKRKSTKRKTTRKKTRKSKKRKHKFPKNPKEGTKKTITVRGRKVTFIATGKKGFGAWRIASSKKA